MSQDPAAMEALAARAAAETMAKMPPPAVNAVLVIDGDQFGQVTMNAQSRMGARTFVPTPVEQG
jgi:hypothetical protein